MYYINKNVQMIERIIYEESRKEYLRLDLNENPGGIPDEFIKHVLEEVNSCFLSEYPEMTEFTNVLAEHIGVKSSNLCIVNGSSEGIRFIIEAFTSRNGKILGVTPSYAMYEVYSRMYERTFIGIPYTDNLEMPIENIINKMTEDIQLLILVNPNNPVGNIYTEEEFMRILSRAKEKNITLLVDEAYFYFYDKTFIKYALTEDFVFITRTFSKLFSLAGARLGYVVGKENGIKYLRNLCTPHNVNAFAMLFAQRLIETPKIIEMLVSKHREGREYLIDELDKNGYEHKGTYGNFIFIKPNQDADIIVQRMKNEKKILIKSYTGIGKFGKCLRVSTAERKYMDYFIKSLVELDKKV